MKDEPSQCILNNFQLENLRRHVYKSSGKTILDPFMQVFWNWLVEQVPVCVAPNMITLIGLLINVGSTLVLVYYSPTGHSEEAPPLAYLTCGVGLFIYQSLDAIDGKHARRTATNSPLGEIFDHGCDAFSTVFVIIAYGIATDLGSSWWFFAVCWLCNFMFYAAHWQTLVSGILHFGKCDVTEAQMFLIAVQIYTGVFGAGLWNYELIAGLPVKHVLLVISSVGTVISFILSGSVASILNGGSGKNGATIADTSVLSPGIPILLISGMFYKILSESESRVFQHNPILFLLTMGFVFTKVTNSLVVAHMTKSPPTLVIDSIMLGPALLLVNQYLNTPVPEAILLWIVMVFTSYDVVRYCCEVCREISVGLHIPCLMMPEGVTLVASKSRNPPPDQIPPKRSQPLRTQSLHEVRRVTRASSRASIARISARRSTDSGSSN